jgi:single-stranded-DNA-specific exonuclease
MRWVEPVSPNTPSPFSDLHPLVATALIRRGITTRIAASSFLDPAAYSPSPAMDLPGMGEAVERIQAAIHAHEPICVWGDFDADGQTSTTVLVQALQALGAEHTYHIPVRESEGHGVNLPHLKEILDQGARLVVTCDTGVTAHQAVEYALTRQVDMVITDHHELPESLPPARAVIDPRLLPPGHPLAGLSGVGVAFKLAEELLAQCPSCSFPPSDLLDLVTMGLVADLAPLTADTRYLVQQGLATLRRTKRLGLQSIMELAELVPSNLTEEHIGFMLGPRLNALGRLGDANPAVELLTTTDAGRARLLASILENYNLQRQFLCSQVIKAAEARLRSDPALLQNPVLVLGNAAWPAGVVGIVASHLVERYRKPAILLTLPVGEPAHGSARSVEGINITSAIAAQKDLLLNFGGHPMAAGLSMEQEKLPEFTRRLFKTVENTPGWAGREEPGLAIDAWLALPEVNMDLAAAIESLAPFGPGNEKLILAAPDLVITSTSAIGKNKEHLKLSVADDNGNSQTVLWWNGAGEDQPEGRFDLAYSVRASNWRGNPEVQVEFVDFRIKEASPVQIKKQSPQIIDFRNSRDPQALLASFQGQPSTILWAEAEAKKETAGRDRNQLEPAGCLVIWTIPPSPEDLQVALETVKPQKVILVGAHPSDDLEDPFLNRLAGLLKYALNHRQGRVTLPELAAGTAQRLVTVELELNWLASRGMISLVRQQDGQLLLAPGSFNKDEKVIFTLGDEIRDLLAEARAYRSYFRQVDLNTLLP